MTLTTFRLDLLDLLAEKEGKPLTLKQIEGFMTKPFSQISRGVSDLKRLGLIDFEEGYAPAGGKQYRILQPGRRFTDY